MKHLLPLALLCAIGILALNAQTVTILDKQGVSHKFNTDYVQEITFSDKEVVEPMEFTTLTAEAYGNGNAELDFRGDGLPIVHLDLYGTSQALYLETGVYDVAASGSEMYIKTDPSYTYVYEETVQTPIVGGRMTVEEGMEGAYDITFAFDLEDGRVINGHWAGLIPGYGKIMNLTASQASQVELNSPEAGQMRIRLSGENYFEATADFYLEPGSVTIPEGNYPYSADKTAGSIGGLCEINFSSPDFKSSVGNAKDGFAFMRDGALTICLDLEDGRTANIAFNGQIKYLEGSDDSINTTFTQTEVSVYGGGNAGITFSNDEGYKVLLDVYGPQDAVYLHTGTYNVSADNSPFSIQTGNYTNATVDDTTLGIASGTMDVTENAEGAYAITMNFTLSDGRVMHGSWTGLLPKYGRILMLTANKAQQIELRADASVPGQMRLRFNDSDYTFESTVDFYLEPGTATLPVDTNYSFSEDKTPGTIGPDTSVDLYNPSTSSKAKAGSVVFVRPGSINLALDLEDGRTVNISFNGEVTYLPAEVEEITYTSCTPVVYSNGNVELKLNGGENDPQLSLDVYGPTDAVYLQPGTYTVASTSNPWEINIGYSTVVKGGASLKPASGTMTVTLDGNDQYIIAVDLVLSDGSALKGTWTGLLSKYGKYVVYKANSAKQVNVNDAAPGQIRILFADADYSIEARVDFFVNPSDTTIPTGMYSYATTGAPNTIGENTSVEVYSPYTNVKATTGSSAFVFPANTSVSLYLEDGRRVDIMYTGEITYLSE